MTKIYILLIATFCLCQSLQGQDKPNVIIIFTDDQGSIDLASFGAEDLQTPNIDKLAKSGVKFTQFYAGAPICSPSRAALLTGLNPHAAGLPSNASSMPGARGMPTENITIAETMQSNGYTTAHIGKWHLGFTEETMPLGQGFDYSFGHMGGCIDNYSHFFYWNGPNRHDLYESGKEVFHDGVYFQDLMVEKASAFIKENVAQPFFMYYAMNLPHYPLQATDKWRNKYQSFEHPRSDYAACVSVIDEKVGQLIDVLTEQNILENTIIIFQSDHGHSVEERAFNGGGNAGIFRGAKTSLFEGGIRVPAIISWKGSIPNNQVRDQVSISMDWFATIADYCQFDSPEIEGKTLKPIIENNEQISQHKSLIWKQGVRWAIRKGPWKLLGLPNDPVNKTSIDPNEDLLFLSNIILDPSEKTNFAKQHPDIKEDLLEEYLKWPHADQDDIPNLALDIPSLAKGKTISLANPAHPKYNYFGPVGLIDEKCGSRYFNDGRWLGFEFDDLESTIDLGKQSEIHSIQVGFLQDASSWIFFPKRIEISSSQDGNNFTILDRIEFEEFIDMNAKKIERINLDLKDLKSRFIRIKAVSTSVCPEWHPNNGAKAWLFVDEITIN